MPLPIKDSVAFRGVPSLGAEKKLALSMTLTQKQVEAMFARQSALRELGSTSYPLEIDFDENKIFIGDIATPFTRYKEDGTREICQRSPTVSKPLAPISFSGNVIGKLSIFRDFDQDVADNVRKATEAEHSKRNERTIVVLDNPPVLSNAKKSRSGSGTSTLAKKAMSNRLVSAQATASRSSISATASRTSTPVASSTVPRSKPPMSSSKPIPSSRSVSASVVSPSSGSATLKEPDLTSPRARLTHLLALDPRTTQQVLLDVGGRSPSAETVREIEDALTAVAQEIQPPKKGPPGPVKWELQSRSWEQVRPYEWPDLTLDQRTRMARKGRLAFGLMNLPSTDPLWEHFKTRTSDLGVLPAPGKGKAKVVASGPTVLKNTEFRGGMFPKEKKPSTKGGGVANGGVTKAKTSVAKVKSKKDQDEVEPKVRKSLVADAKGKDKANSASSNISSIPAARIPKKKKQEEVIVPSSKARTSMGVVRRESSPASKAIRVRDEGISKRKQLEVDTDGTSEMEEGEVVVEPDAKRRKTSGIGESVRPRISGTQSGSRDPSMKNIKEQVRAPVKEESVPPKLGKDVATSRVSVGTSSKSVAVGSKAQRLEERDHDTERLSEREREKRRSNGKRGRRATPSFSSDEEEEEPKKPPTSVRPPVATTSKSKPASHPPSSKVAPQTPTSSKVTSQTPKAAPSRAPAPSPVLPTDKDALRRRYHMCYARYMGVTSKIYEQLAKVETLLAADTDTDDDIEMMETEELMQLRGEHDRLRDELQRILHAHASAF